MRLGKRLPKLLRLAAALLLAAGLLTGYRSGAKFAPAQKVGEHRGASGTVAGDLDRDGNAEMVVAVSGLMLRIYSWNAEKGGFDHFDVLELQEMDDFQDRFGNDLALADLNGDGWPDIIVPDSSFRKNKGHTGGLYWFENPEGKLDGKWTRHTVSEWNGEGDGNRTLHMGDLDTGDIDGNGHVDIAVRDTNHGVWLLLRTDDGTGWQERRFIPTRPREGLALFDADGDKDLDLALNGVWLETPDDPLAGEFKVHEFAPHWYPPEGQFASVMDYAAQVEAADFNRDGRTDIVITNSEMLKNAKQNAIKPRGVHLYLAPKDPRKGKWQHIELHGKWNAWHSLEIGDFDRDGTLDVISGTSPVGKGDKDMPSVIMLFLNQKKGTQFTQTVIDEEKMYQPSVGDVDGDGDPDLLAPYNFNSGAVRFYRNDSTLTK